jgi:hypothetical protein
MVRELIAAGLVGPARHAKVERLTGLPPGDAAMIIDAYMRERRRDAQP